MYYVKKTINGDNVTLIVRLRSSKIGFTYPDAVFRINDECYYMDMYIGLVSKCEVDTCDEWLNEAKTISDEEFKNLKVFNQSLGEMCDYFYSNLAKTEDKT